jgi:phosphoribosylanthranilate isomerase
VTRVKICGIREVAHAVAAAEAGADLLGFIFYRPARRYVEPSLARAIADAQPTGRVELVGVLLNQERERKADIAQHGGLDRIQLSGDEPVELNARLARPVVRTVHVDATTTAAEIESRVRGAALIHLDTKRAGSYGGTGQTFDWTVARAAAELGPVLLAGGLDPGNVAQAIGAAAAWGVDVSTGVELDGVKDPTRIAEFLRAVRALEAVAS